MNACIVKGLCSVYRWVANLMEYIMFTWWPPWRSSLIDDGWSRRVHRNILRPRRHVRNPHLSGLTAT